MYIAPGQGQTTFVDKIVISTEYPCHFAHLLQVFMFLYMYIAPGQGQTSPW